MQEGHFHIWATDLAGCMVRLPAPFTTFLDAMMAAAASGLSPHDGEIMLCVLEHEEPR